MANVIADAYIALYTQMPGVEKDIARSLDRVDTDSAGKKIGKSTSDGVGKGFALGGAIAGITATLTSMAAQSIGALVSDAVAASDATDKFKQTLDFAGIDTTTVDTLAKQTRGYADATVYGLSDIQNTVAQLAANGVADYAALTEASGNLNAVAGGNAETFKSVGMVLTQTAGAGKLTTENWNQLADAIPGASGMLQDALLQAGAYTGNFREAMEKGEISAEEFNAAIMQLGTDPIAVEAAKSTVTFEGAIGSLQATIVGGLSDALTSVKPLLTGLITGFSDVIGRVFDFIGALDLGSIDFSMFAELAGYLSPLGLIFQVLQPVLPMIAAALGQVFAIIADAVSSILPVLLPVLTQVVTTLADLAAQVIPMLLPVIVQLAEMFGQILEAVMPIVVVLINALMPIFEALIPVILTILGAFLPLVSLLIDALMPIFLTIADILVAILIPVLNTVVGVIQWLAQVVQWAITQIIAPFFQNVLIPIISNVGQIFQDVFGGLGDFFSGIWSGIERGFKGFINFIIDGINGFIGGLNEVGNFVSDVTGGSIDFHIGKLPRLAAGGLVPAQPGGMAAILGEGRYDEVVVPLSPEILSQLQGGGGLRDGQEIVLMVDGQAFRAYVKSQAADVVSSAAAPFSGGRR